MRNYLLSLATVAPAVCPRRGRSAQCAQYEELGAVGTKACSDLLTAGALEGLLSQFIVGSAGNSLAHQGVLPSAAAGRGPQHEQLRLYADTLGRPTTLEHYNFVGRRKNAGGNRGRDIERRTAPRSAAYEGDLAASWPHPCTEARHERMEERHA